MDHFQARTIERHTVVDVAPQRTEFDMKTVGAAIRTSDLIIRRDADRILIEAHNGTWDYQIVGTDWIREVFVCSLVNGTALTRASIEDF